MSNWDYERDESRNTPPTGKMRCVIVGAEETVSKKSGLPMIIVTVQPSGSKAKVKQYIVKNEYFNRNMTQLFDAFPSIGDGNFEFLEWIGAMGAANFVLNEDGYLRIKWFIGADQAKDLPEFVGDKPDQQTVTKLDELTDDDDDLPFSV